MWGQSEAGTTVYFINEIDIGVLIELDDELISFDLTVEISALKEEEQKQLLEAMDYAQVVPSKTVLIK